MKSYAPLQRRPKARPKPAEPAPETKAVREAEQTQAPPPGVPLFLRAGGAGEGGGPRVPVAPRGGDAERAAEGVARAAADASAPSPFEGPLRDGPVQAATSAGLPAASAGEPLPRAVRERVEPLVGADLDGVRVHADATARRTARGLGARAFAHGPNVWLGPDARTDDVALLAHEAVHTVQQARAGEAVVQRDPLPLSADDATVLSGYPSLMDALPAAEWRALADAARRRRALQRGTDPGPDAGFPTVSGTLGDFLPEGAVWVPREEILRTHYGSLGTAQGPAPGAMEAARAIAVNETLRTYLADRADQQVMVDLADPEGLEAGGPQLRMSVFGIDLPHRNGVIPVDALDALGTDTLAQVADAAGADAEQLISVAVAEAQAAQALPEALDVAAAVRQTPGRYALAPLRRLDEILTGFASRVTTLRDGLRAANADMDGALTSIVVNAEAARDAVRDSTAWLARWQAPSIPSETAGEYWSGELRADERRMEANWNAGGWSYLWLPVNALNYTANSIFQGAGNLVTAGHMDREARTAWMYRTGQISNDAYVEQTWWDMGASVLTIGIMALTAGLGGRLAGGLLGVEATSASGFTTVAAAEGLVGGTLTAVGSDVYATIAAGVSSNPEVEQMQRGSRVGPMGWLHSGAMGMTLGAGAGAVLWRVLPPSALAAPAEPVQGGGGTGQGGAAARPGVEIVDLGEHGIRITQAGAPEMMMMDNAGWRVLSPSGTGMRVVASGGFGGPAEVTVPGGGGGGSTALAVRPRVLWEPFTGPDLMAPTSLAIENPGARVIGSEASPGRVPSLAQQEVFGAFGGEFVQQRFPSMPGQVDHAVARFPLPHVQMLDASRMRVGLEIARNPTVSPMDVVARVQGEIESLTNLGPRALENVRPGGALEIIFHERAIMDEVADLLAARHTDPVTGAAFRFEMAEPVATVPRADFAPYSGHGVGTPEFVFRTVLRKVPDAPPEPLGGPGGPLPGGGVLAIPDAVTPQLNLMRQQRAATLRIRAAGYAAEAAELERRATALSGTRGDRAARMRGRAVSLRARAADVDNFAQDVAEGYRSYLDDLPGPADVDALFANPQAELGVSIPLSESERFGAGTLPRDASALQMGPNGGRMVYRVEGGGSRELVSIDPATSGVTLGRSTGYYNFGSLERAHEFLAKRGPGARIVAFEVDDAWVRSLRSATIPEGGTGPLQGQPRLVDVRFAHDQFEIPPRLVPEMEQFILPGSGTVIAENP